MKPHLGLASPLAMLVAAALGGCSAHPTMEPEVAVAAPVQRLDLPEAPARRVSAGFDSGAAQTNVVLSENQGVAAPQPGRATFEQGHGASAVWLEAYPVKALGLGVSVHTNGGDVGADDHDDDELPIRGRVKLHVLEAAGFSVALTGAYGERSYSYFMNHAESSGFFGDEHLVDDYVTRIDAFERDFALVAGYRPAPSVLVFGGPFVYQQPYSGTHVDHVVGRGAAGAGSGSGSGSGSEDCTVAGLLCDDDGGGAIGGGEQADAGEPAVTSFSDEIRMHGVNLGIAVNLGLPELRLIAEVARARIATGGREDDSTGVSLAFRGDFGGRL